MNTEMPVVSETQSPLLRREYGLFLSRYHWQFYFTLTFKHPADIWYGQEAFKRMIRRLEQRAESRVPWFRAFEWGLLGRLHVHGLLASEGLLTPSAITKAWKVGQTDVQLYDPERGAAYYVTKTVSHPLEEYDISRCRPPAYVRPR